MDDYITVSPVVSVSSIEKTYSCSEPVARPVYNKSQLDSLLSKVSFIIDLLIVIFDFSYFLSQHPA